MEDIGFKSSFFKIEPVDPTDKKFTEEPHILNIGFIKNVPKSAVNKN
jgi:hypothetical protein